MNTMRHFKSRLKFWNNMLKEAMLVEGKHWPEDYIKAAINKLKTTEKYNGSKTDTDVATIAQRFKPKFHTNAALGYFNSVVRWYSEDPDNFIKPKRSDGIQPEDKLETSLNFLKLFLNTLDLVLRDGDKVKNSMNLADFSSMMKKISDEDKAKADNAKFKVEYRGYKIIPFMTYEDLHEKFGGSKTGYRGKSEWCHTNGKSTYESWTNNYTKFFFVIAKDNWEVIEPKENPQKSDNAYDEYGLSLMAILVSREGELLNCTLRWNHVVEPSAAKPGREVDKAFISYAELSQVTGLDVEAEVKRQLAEILEKVNKVFRGKKVYEGLEGICFARDHFYWYDNNFNPIDPPERIKGSIILGFYNDITSLEGSPRFVGRIFDCSGTMINSLEGGPEEVGGSFSCSSTSITSLKGAPKIVGGSFTCSSTRITSLEGGPEEVGGSFSCAFTNITSLEGCPKKVGGGFNCSNTNITSLEGCPEKVRGNFWCGYTSITSLEGGPKSVHGYFNCSDTNITSLEGCPREVGEEFFCQRTLITSLKGAPAEIGGIEYSEFPESISALQLDAYKDWLKTNPTDNYPG